MIYNPETFNQNLTQTNLSPEWVATILEALKHLSEHYKFEYINAPDNRLRNVEDSIHLNVSKTIEWLRSIGQNSTADTLKSIIDKGYLTIEEPIKTKKGVWSNVRKYLKQELVSEKGMKESMFNKIAHALEETFIQACKEFPPKNSPDYLDINWEPPY